MPVGMTYRELKQHLRIEHLWYRNSMADWAGDANLGLVANCPIIDAGQPNPRLSTALGMPCLRVDANDQHLDTTPLAYFTYLAESTRWIIEWAGVPGQPLDALVTPDVPLPMCLIGTAGEGTFIQLVNPGEIQVNLGNLVGSVNPGLGYYWANDQPLHLLVFRSTFTGQPAGYNYISVFVNGCRVELTPDSDASDGALCSPGMLFNYDPVQDQRPFIGSHFLFRVYDYAPDMVPMDFTDGIALLMFNRVRNAFPTLRWPIPVNWAGPG